MVPSDLKGLLREALLDVCMTDGQGGEGEQRQDSSYAMEQLKGQTGKGKGEMKGLLKDTLLEIVRPEDILAGIPVPQKGQQAMPRDVPDKGGGGKGDRSRKGKGKHDGYDEPKKAHHQEEQQRWQQPEEQRWQMPQQHQEVPWAYPSGAVSYPFVVAGDGRTAGAGEMAFNPFFPPGVQLAQIPAWSGKGVQVAMPMGTWPAQTAPTGLPGVGMPVPGAAPDPKSYASPGAPQMGGQGLGQSQPSHQPKDKPPVKERKQKQNQKGGPDQP